MAALRRWLARAAVLLGLPAVAAPLNLVVIVADDLGAHDTRADGSRFYDTPHLDQLARQGARFTAAYAAGPVCSPSRASLMTGQEPLRSGITDVIGRTFTPEAWTRNTRLLPATHADRLAHRAVTIAECLQAAGYATFFAGKWHLGPEGWWPEDQGFAVNRGGTGSGGPYGGGRYFSPFANPRLKDGPAGEHLGRRLARETARFIAEAGDQPFFAYLATYDVHTPLMAPAELVAKYALRREEQGLSSRWGREGPRELRLTQDHPVYAAMVETFDGIVGTVLAQLESSGLAERTLVVVTSDNGGVSTGDEWGTSNYPLRAGKGWLYEGGIRVPLLVRWPGKTRPGSEIAVPVSGLDLFPTLLEASELTPPADWPLDGRSLSSALGAQPAERSLRWHFPHYGNLGGAPGAAIRRGEWKLITWFEDDAHELFHLGDDPSETRNLLTAAPDVAASLLQELRGWQQERGARFPIVNPRFDPMVAEGRGAAAPPAFRGGAEQER